MEASQDWHEVVGHGDHPTPPLSGWVRTDPDMPFGCGRQGGQDCDHEIADDACFPGPEGHAAPL
jgi:hypothetical protein